MFKASSAAAARIHLKSDSHLGGGATASTRKGGSKKKKESQSLSPIHLAHFPFTLRYVTCAPSSFFYRKDTTAPQNRDYCCGTTLVVVSWTETQQSLPLTREARGLSAKDVLPCHPLGLLVCLSLLFPIKPHRAHQ